MGKTAGLFSIGKFVGFLTLLVNSSILGQNWTQLTYPTYGQGAAKNAYLTPYFLNPKIGFIFSSGDNTPHLSRTNDGGKTWTYIPFFDTVVIHIDDGPFSGSAYSGLSVSQLSFVSPA